MIGKIKKDTYWNKYTKELMSALLAIFIWVGDGFFAIFIARGHLNWGWWFLVAFIFLVGLFFTAVSNEIISIEIGQKR